MKKKSDIKKRAEKIKEMKSEKKEDITFKNINMYSKVKAACGYANVSQKELAAALDISESTLSQKIKRSKMSIDKYEEIAEKLGAKLEVYFCFSEGTRI